MAILAALFAFGSRFATKILATALGWASTLLFGRVPASRQILLLGITFGSVIWMVLMVGIVVPDVGAALLVLVPRQDIVPEGTIRLIMLAGALVAPAVIGAMTIALTKGATRTAGDVIRAVGRGYPLTVLLAVLLVFLALLAIWRKTQGVARRWTDAHVPFVVEPGAYEQVAADLDRAVSDAGLDVSPSAAPRAMSQPARWLAAIGGSEARTLVPDRMIQLRGPGLDILIYPTDLLISGRPELVARARAAMASRLTTSSAHLTVSAEAQAIEDRITTLAGRRDDPDARPRFDDDAATTLASIDDDLATMLIPYEEWEVLYRQRLQVERDLRAHAMDDPDHDGPAEAASGPISGAALMRWLRDGTEVAVATITDERTAKVVERIAGTPGRLGIGVLAAAVDAVVERRKRTGVEAAADSTDDATVRRGPPSAL